MRSSKSRLCLVLAFASLCAASLMASAVLKMTLEDMVGRAGSIFRGTVVSASPGTVDVGGGTLRTVDYVIEVTEEFKGSFESKDGKSFTTIRMIAGAKDGVDGNIRRFSKLPDLPDLKVGADYLLLATTPGPSGLSTTVGLGQGCFDVATKGDPATAVNELGNQGLSPTINGPVEYDQLADEIRALLGQ